MQDQKVRNIRKTPIISEHDLNLFITQAREERRKESVSGRAEASADKRKV